MREQRQELGIATDSEGTAQLPPDLALINAALGGFRSWAINFMWLRATKLQEEHRVHEAAQLAKWITALSPRFERVWTFQAWNLAFNISRQGQTEADRWRWVVDGLDLLRQRGIEINPLSLHLHAWLSYCFWFKVGGELDEAHRYFKHAHSLEWQQFLGTPPDEAEARLAWFREIALAPSSLTELLEREPRFAPIVDGLDGLGFALDRELLFRLSGAVATAGSDGPSRDGREGALAPIGELLASQDLTDGFLRFLRAKVLREHYHMDPYLMLDLMETLGPFDWRHECSQGAYWIAQGVLRRANQQREVRLTAGHDDLVRVMDRSETLICLRRIALESGGSTGTRPRSVSPDSPIRAFCARTKRHASPMRRTRSRSSSSPISRRRRRRRTSSASRGWSTGTSPDCARRSDPKCRSKRSSTRTSGSRSSAMWRRGSSGSSRSSGST